MKGGKKISSKDITKLEDKTTHSMQ